MEAVKVADILAPWFSRGDLPERIAIMDDQPRVQLFRGALLTWSEERRAYLTPAGDFCVLAAYVRKHWLVEFCPPSALEAVA